MVKKEGGPMAYYFGINGARVGPLDEEAIREKISQNQIQGNTLVWTVGLDRWVETKEVPELTVVFPEVSCLRESSPPPLPSELSNDKVPQEALADFGERLVAGLIDALVGLIPSIIVNSIIPFVGGLFIYGVYYAYCMSVKGGGQTVGYKAMKLKLIDQDSGRGLSVGSVIGWYLVYTFGGVIGWIWFFTDQRRRMLHNMASRSLVVKVSDC
jgi:uncharacterized RDD family membrane protein YckC